MMKEKIVDKIKNKFKRKIYKLICLLLCVTQIIFLFSPTILAASSNLRNSTYAVDSDTTDDYITHMINAKNGSRYAGRIWTDKSVFREGITLDNDTDGYEGTITNNSDFLHAFSVLGSSLKITQPTQLDVMFLLDVSGSMGKVENGYATKKNFEQTPMYKTIEQVNISINTLLEKSPDSRFGIAIYGSTAAILVPLGHYTKDNNTPFLKVEYKDLYGGTDPSKAQGLHFKLTATVKNKENVTKTYYGDNAGETSNKVHNMQGNGNREYEGTGGQTSGSGTEKDPYHVGHITNQQAGLAIAMDQFITNNNEITWKTDDKSSEYPRLPTLIHLTDGQASDLAWIQNEVKVDSSEYESPECSVNLPIDEDEFSECEPDSQDCENELPKCEIKSPEMWEKTFSNWNNVNWNYDLAYNSTNSSELENINHYNASQLSGLGDAAPVIFQTLMTAAYYKSAVDAYYTSSGITDLSGNLPSLNCYSIYASDSADYTNMEDTQIKGTLNAILNPSRYFTDLADSSETDSGKLTAKDSGAKFIDTAYELYKLWLSDESKGVDKTFSLNTTSANSSGNDIIISIKALQSHLTDNSGAYAQDKYKEWSNKINVEAIKKNINYVPSGNFYSTGFEDIGNVLSNIVESVAGNAFAPVDGMNDLGNENSVSYMDPLGKYMEIKDNGITIDNQTYDMAMLLFGELHYLNKTKVFDYQFIQKHLNNGSFKAGWYDTKGNYKENGNWDSGDTYYIDESTFKSLYPNMTSSTSLNENQKNTIYTFYEFTDSDSNKFKTNPCYNGESTKYSLSDIKIWNEDTSNLKDDTGLKTDNTLYVDIPINALPLQIVSVTLIGHNEVSKYETNIEEKEESTPLRLFYGVGIQDALLFNNGIDIDLDLISEEYKKKYTNENDEISFYSNYYSATTYDGYTADTQEDARTKGDTVLSISPNMKNRYYVFQKNLMIYSHAYIIGADGQVKEESDPLNFEGADFDGVYDGKTEDNKPDETGLKSIKEAFEKNELKEGDIIFLSGDTVSYGTDPSSDDFYYFAIDYFVPTEDNKGKQVQYVVARKGSEFGSGIAENPGAKLPKGDFLSWIDASGRNQETFDFSANIPEDTKSSGTWVLATKIGGLRIGDLHQSILRKQDNNTNTSKSYYLPIIADDLTTEGYDAILDAYLGNNGLLTYKIEKWEIPAAGSIGTIIIILLGITLIILSSLLYKRHKRGVITDKTN